MDDEYESHFGYNNGYVSVAAPAKAAKVEDSSRHKSSHPLRSCAPLTSFQVVKSADTQQKICVMDKNEIQHHSFKVSSALWNELWLGKFFTEPQRLAVASLSRDTIQSNDYDVLLDLLSHEPIVLHAKGHYAWRNDNVLSPSRSQSHASIAWCHILGVDNSNLGSIVSRYKDLNAAILANRLKKDLRLTSVMDIDILNQ